MTVTFSYKDMDLKKPEILTYFNKHTGESLGGASILGMDKELNVREGQKTQSSRVENERNFFIFFRRVVIRLGGGSTKWALG